MCGIIGYNGCKEATDVLIDGLRRLEYRGYDSAGIAVSDGATVQTVKSKGRLDALEEKLKQGGSLAGHCGIGHTRWATHGAPSDLNSHPHGTKKVTVVHNGIIENYLQLKKKLMAYGYTCQTDTDTEVLALLLDYYYHGDPCKAIYNVTVRLEGSYALGILFSDRPDCLYAVRKDSPLIVGIGRNESFIASDVPAILPYTRDYYLIEAGEVATLERNAVRFHDTDGEEIAKEIQTASWEIETAERGGYPHFMLKEIHEQPAAIQNTITPHIKDNMPQMQISGLDVALLREVNQIHIVACGTAMHAGMVGKYAIEQLARMPVTVEIASEFRYANPILKPSDLVVVVSQSGETADTLAALRLAKERGVHTLAIVNVVGSSIAREADSVCYTYAGPEIAVASTKAYTVQVSIFYVLALELAKWRDTLPEEKMKQHCQALSQLPHVVKSVLKEADAVQRCAAQFQTAHDLFFIGRGIDYALSLEGSLKLKEISYIHSEAYPSGELKHGAIALVTDGVPILALATQQALWKKTVSNIKEAKVRGGMVLLICRDDIPVEAEQADYILRVPVVQDIFMPIPSAVLLQLFAYDTAVLRGCDVDKPRNLAKSVTVE